uniref:non-ribosomal peptide synthetase n=1 Tax=Teredinibacter turnerae TaxID=2426 RepID=UPI0005F8269E
GRWLDDGNIEYLGRIDTQIKIRGFRVELGEIESRLNTYKDIMDSVVVARGEAGDSHLVAFYVAQATQANKLITLDEQSLRAYLAEQLPEYMLPVAYVSLEHIPLTPNGKVDRRCLELQEVVITSSHSYVAASTDTEKQLVTLWAQVLKRDKDRIGIHDNFFELGGHSLMATQLLAKLRQQLGVNLPLKKLFDYPTIFRLAHAVDDDQTSGQVLPVIPVIDRHQLNRLPLSFAQERLWFTHQLDPNSGAYNIPGAIRLTGGFSLQELDLAFATLITRHEILRTVFPSCDGVVEQEIKPGSDFQIDFRDISDQPDVDLRESRTQELCEEEAARPFDLAVGPLMRCLVIKREDGDHVILLNMHHIISDGWSLDILIRELSEVLSARREEREARLAPLPIQYVDYCVWQREYLREGPELSRQMGYWTQQLANAPESLALPTDFPRPKEQSYKGATHAFTLDKQTTAALKALSEAQGCTLYMTVLAVANVLFYRYSGQSDICVGSPIANRQHAETESVMGLFVNTLVFRNHVNGEQPFVEFLQQVKEVCLQAYAHQDIPFEKLVEVLQPHRNPAINPLFQVMLAFQNAGETENYNNSTKSSRVYELPRNRSKFDLTVEIDDTSDEISGVIEYSTRLFTSSRIARMASHFCFLCGSIVNDENVPLHALNIISEKEKNILNKFQNPTATLPIPSVGIQQLLLEQVHKTPSAAAIVCEDESLSYTEFYERSLELALYLQSLGCNPDDIVGICMNSPIDLLVGLWGVILAGSAYVIFDPKNPKERLLYLIEDSRAQIILSDISEKVRLTVGENEKITIIEFGDNFEIIKTQAQSLIESGCRFRESQNPDNLVYLVYTSGSTGNPKGAANFHRGFANLNQWYIRDLGLSSADRILVISNPSFDLTQKNFVAPLLVGASIYLVKEYDPFVIRQIIHREKISWINCAPSSFYGILEAPYSDISSLTTVVLGGEPIQTNLLTGWFDCGQNVRLINSYGPSEASDVVTSYTYDALSQVSLIGKPIKNVEIYILDCYQKSQPIGIPGEIYVGGIGVSRGYINRPELTAEKFIDNPFEPGSVMYRTGDLGRWLDDGNIEYLGRIDTQIKIRGFRVELGEIESRLNTYKDIMDSVVVARGEAGDSHLVAFYVAQATQANKLITLDEQSLRAYLAEQLPEYMLPVAYVSLEHIPLTPNGKVDRRCLELQEVVITSSHSYVAASTDTEKQLVTLWAQVLKRDKDRIGIHDNFFELGGHSLMATQLLAKLRQQLGVNLPLKKLFDYPTIFRLAHAVDDDQTSGQVL